MIFTLRTLKVKLYSSFCLTKHHAMKTYWGSRRTASCLLNLGTRLGSVGSYTLRPLYSREKRPLYPLDKRLGGPLNQSRSGEEKNSLSALPGIEPSHWTD